MYLQAIVQFTIAFRSGKIESTFGDFDNIKREQQIQFKDMNETRRTIGGLALPALLLTLLLLFVSQTECRAAGETENESDIASLPPDVDNVELHRVKLVNGVMTEDHPIVMYKEDFVNEDYDPTQSETKAKPTRKYKQLKRMRHHYSTAEKIRFDVLPETPIFVDDADDSGADNFEAASLLEPSKQETLQKYPKKYHSRQRRQAYYYNRNHYYVQPYQYPPSPAPYYLPVATPNQYQHSQVEGKKPKYRGKQPPWQTKPTKPNMPTDIGTRLGEPDENSLFHDSNPANADFSVFNQPRPAADTPRPSSSNRQTPTTRPPFGGFQSPPESPVEQPPRWEPSPQRRPATNRPTTSAPAASRRTTPRVSSCVWAIVNCCSQGNSDIHYNCFEEFGCHGAFWGVNPCADNVRDGAIASLTRSFSTGPPSLRQ
ncbi:uncharacterized protein LOC117573894 isoform X2 [Drosophila albomicans]|uniref:Uncharacterized protein LOC117573894 isoform X2 n=1 Tax=Drosophila albomicans TaxID=7291 RepID=A0A6P8XK05_DROAB|nr:uncharacterized protein LOC117573894 isoform X2 [Drosophila albomicans]